MFNAYDFPLDKVLSDKVLVHRKKGARKKANEREIVDIVTAFDIECTTIHVPIADDVAKRDEHAFMYVWQWAFGQEVVIGRTWDEFTFFCERIRDAMEQIRERARLDKRPLLVAYVHNLAYEWQFLAGIYEFAPEDTFFAKTRKPLYCRMYDAIEMRCSYKQTNMSLEKFAEKMGATVRKESGQKFDYRKVRYPWTELSEVELKYIVGDVLCLVEAMEIQMKRDGDTLLSIPLTSTGYVRRDCKKALSAQRNYVIKPMLPGVREYRLLRQAFRGGNTHANARYVGQILENVESVDMASCYPAQQLTEKFPMTKFQMLRNADIDRVLRFIVLGYAVVAEWKFSGLRLKNPNEPIPYLSLSKTKSTGFRVDNGRVLCARYCETTLTEIDLEIVLDTYDYDEIQVGQAMVAQKAYLPIEYRQVILDYYKNKTTLKKRAEFDDEVAYLYMKSKNLLNAIFGMSAQDPIHQRVTFVANDFVVSDYNDDEAVKDLGKAPFPYQWGVYTTSLGRKKLQEGIKLAGDRVVYVDTDSVKTLGHVDFTGINVSRETIARKMGAFAQDENGVDRCVGVFEVDGVYEQFITQGAKRYAVIHGSGKKAGQMSVTVSGVTQKPNEETGIPYCVEELGTLERFAPGMEWIKAGGTAAVYNDADDFIYHSPEGDVHITRNVAIYDTTYKMSHSKDYVTLLKELVLYGRYKETHE